MRGKASIMLASLAVSCGGKAIGPNAGALALDADSSTATGNESASDADATGSGDATAPRDAAALQDSMTSRDAGVFLDAVALSADTSVIDATSEDGGAKEVWDANIANGTVSDASIDAINIPTGLAGFAFVINGVVQSPMTCPVAAWEFPLPNAEGKSSTLYPPVPGIHSVFIVNTGARPMAYTAQNVWNPGSAVPGGGTGASYQLAGVLDPGTQVNITSVYVGGITAILGSAEPFSSLDAGKYVADEGAIPWPPGVSGSGGASVMYVAEIEVAAASPSTCTPVFNAW